VSRDWVARRAGPRQPAARRVIISKARWQPPAAARQSPHRSDSPVNRPICTLATELNPHNTELNLHQAVSAGQPRQSRSASGAFPQTTRSSPATGQTRRSRRLRSAAPVTHRHRRRR